MGRRHLVDLGLWRADPKLRLVWAIDRDAACISQRHVRLYLAFF